MTIGTCDGCWFSFDEHVREVSLTNRSDRRIDYEFYRFGDCIAAGTCADIDDMWAIFNDISGSTS